MHDEAHSERSGAASSLVESEARLSAILGTAVDGIITIDERGNIESFNAAAERLFGYSADDVVGRNVSLLMPEPDAARHDEYIRRYLCGGRARIIGIGREVMGLRKDGGTFPMDLAVSEVRLGDRRIFTGIVRDLTDRKRMERELLEISDREQRRIGQDLHDGLGQVLAGVGFMIKALEQRLAAAGAAEAGEARQISELVTQAIAQARAMARGLHPVRQIETGLLTALEELAQNIQTMYRVQCRFVCEEPVTVAEGATATHVYRIAQEAASNAIRHGKASRITIALIREPPLATLTVADDGVGFSEAPLARKGMGLHTMRYRAGIIGGSLTIRRGAAGGTFVTCSFPLPQQSEP